MSLRGSSFTPDGCEKGKDSVLKFEISYSTTLRLLTCKASLLAASAQHEGLPHGVGAPRHRLSMK